MRLLRNPLKQMLDPHLVARTLIEFLTTWLLQGIIKLRTGPDPNVHLQPTPPTLVESLETI